MKQAMNKTKMITMGLITLFTMGLTSVTRAAGVNENPVEIKFLGSVENHPVFQLNLNNKDAEQYVITLRDATNQILFTEKTNTPDFSRNYKLDIDEADFRTSDFQLRVEVTSLKTNATQVYKISTKSRVVEDVIIAKL
ncbi:MAG: hypothetical protein M3Z56_03015 [Bacteroidota bacterium]|nr:hypothetical protein [Bacteroidota bacterium]